MSLDRGPDVQAASTMIGSSAMSEANDTSSHSMPIASQWLLDSVGDAGREVVESVAMIVCPNAGSKGTGFLTDTGILLTNEHVVRGCAPAQLQVIDSAGNQHSVEVIAVDNNRDLAALRPDRQWAAGLRLDPMDTKVGTQVSAWGFPLGYKVASLD